MYFRQIIVMEKDTVSGWRRLIAGIGLMLIKKATKGEIVAVQSFADHRRAVLFYSNTGNTSDVMMACEPQGIWHEGMPRVFKLEIGRDI